MEKIKAFWNWFDAHKDAYANFTKQYNNDLEQINAALNKMIDQLQKVSEGLFVEIGGGEAPWELIITPQGAKDFFADAFAVVQEAPDYPDWKILATKPAYGTDFSFRMGDVEISPDTVRFIPLEMEDRPDDIAIRLFHSDYQEGKAGNAVVMGIYQALDSLLGEVSTTFDIDYLEFSSAPEEGINPLPLSELAGYIRWKKKERPLSGVRFPEDQVSLLQGENNGKPIIIIVNQQLRNYEFKTEYPYILKVTLLFDEVSEEGFPVGSMDAVYAIEDQLQKRLGQEANGHFLVTETYDGKRKIHFAGASKEVLETQVNVLKKELKSPYTIQYDIYFDPFWVSASGYM